MSKKEVEENIDTEPRLYELGFHVIPLVSEADVPLEFTKIKDVIEAAGGAVFSSEMPKMMTLAYKIPKVIANKRTWYETAYFGWVRFNVLPEKALEIKAQFGKNENILRFILIKVVLQKVQPGSASRMTFITNRKSETPKKEESSASEPALSDAEIDKTIEELMVS